MNPMQTLSLVGMAFLVSGCGPSIDQTPTAAFMAMNNALCRTPDATVMLDYVTAASKPIVVHLILPVQQIAKALPVDVIFEQGCVGEKANLQVLREITYRQVAAITYLEGKDIKSMRLLRENGAWKINLTPPAGTFPDMHGAIPIPSLTSYRTSVQIWVGARGCGDHLSRVGWSTSRILDYAPPEFCMVGEGGDLSDSVCPTSRELDTSPPEFWRGSGREVAGLRGVLGVG